MVTATKGTAFASGGKRAPGASIKIFTLGGSSLVNHPWIEARKYHTRLGSMYSTPANSISGRRSARDF